MAKTRCDKKEITHKIMNIYEEEIYTVETESFLVKYEQKEVSVYFEVYPILSSEDDEEWYYLSKEDCTPIYNIEESSEMLVERQFYGSYCWRGVSDSRIHFTKDEYYDFELELMHRLYNEFILPNCQRIIEEARHE